MSSTAEAVTEELTEITEQKTEQKGSETTGKTEQKQESKASKEDLEATIKDQDWRSDLPEDLRKTAERFASKADAVRAIESFRKRESQVRVPGKDATDDEKAAYRKAVGIPDKAELYEFSEIKGQELTDEIKTSRQVWSKRFHELGIPKDTAKNLSKMVNEDALKYQTSQIEADKTFAISQEEALKSEWKDDFDKNKTFANRAFMQMATRAGLNMEDLSKIETKDGRFLMDRAEMLRIFSVIGREMSEGTLGPALSEDERETVADEVRDIRKQISEAQESGNSKRANQLYQKEQKILSKMGNKSIVGVDGRMV
ncbi:MAG TPA: hypothetical protein VJ044_00935 [Candidatus Hodarchaeales archaeon]|nr:hypothetical protein [Candidatus Hodarchaeales archaeon]